MKKNNCLVLIDCQNDFCVPQAPLYVPGADKDMERLSKFILNNKEEIDFIVLTMDSHQKNHIAHPNFWKDQNGNPPPIFTQITLEDVKQLKWIPKFNPEEVVLYLKKLEEEGLYTHYIWPEHCLSGSDGAKIEKNVYDSLMDWAQNSNKFYDIIYKGLNPMTEFFGAFMAQVTDIKDSSTQFNFNLLLKLSEYKNIFIAGEAKSHCVASSIKQMLVFLDGTLAPKMIILEDTMSDVPTLGHLGKPVFDKAKELGVRFSNTIDVLKPILI